MTVPRAWRQAILILIAATFSVSSCSRKPGVKPPPRLIVVISIDQMRADTFERFAPLMKGGLERFFENGLWYTQANHDHALTSTAAGHAALSTGTFPGHSGIISNAWWDREAWKSIYAVDDTVRIVGKPGAQGSSPRNLKRSTFASWLKTIHPESKVYAVSMKDRVSTLMAGSVADGAFWWYDEDGDFVTSTYYAETLSEVVTKFNTSRRADAYFAKGWDRLLPETAYTASREDDFPSEGDGRNRTFPHRFTGDAPSLYYYNELRSTPFGDELVFDLAGELLREEALGRDEIPDFLFVGASAADGVGHSYGAFSQESEDYYLRLDGWLDSFLKSLDKQVGKGRYLAVLTSDHGCMPMPEELQRRGVDSRRVNNREIVAPALNQIIQELGASSLKATLAGGVYLKDEADTLLDMTAIRKRLQELVREHEAVADAFTWDELNDPNTPDRPYLQVFKHSFDPSRSPDVMLHLKEYVIPVPQSFGTTHETAYAYDTHVPLVFLEPDLAPATVGRSVRTVDLAPTLASVLGIPAPADVDGVTLPEVLQPWRVEPVAASRSVFRDVAP